MTKSAQVLAVCNQKGGVGKTTVSTHLAAALGEMGHRVLLIDMDSMSGSTRAFGLEAEWLGTAEVLLGREPTEFVLRSSDTSGPGSRLPPNVDLMPARRNIEALRLDYGRLSEAERDRLGPLLQVLNRPLATFRRLYDYVLLDTAPNAAEVTMNAYLGADWFIISTQPSKLAFDGLVDALRDIRDVKDHGAHGRLLGIVLCRVERRSIMSTRFHERISRLGEAFRTVIHSTVKVEQGQDSGETLFSFASSHAVTDEFRALAREVLARIEERSEVVTEGLGEQEDG